MTLRRDKVGDDLEAVKAFNVELGMEIEGEIAVEGNHVDLLIGLPSGSFPSRQFRDGYLRMPASVE